MEWKSESSLEQGPFSLVGQNFSWQEYVGQKLEQQRAGRQRAGNLRNAVRRLCVKSNARAFASRSKAKAKPQRCTSASSSTKTIPIGERTSTDIEPQDYSLTDYSVSKKLITLLRHGSLRREDDGAIEFWRIKDYLQNHFVHSRHWSDAKWKSTMAKKLEATRKDFNIVPIHQAKKFFTSELFKVIQDAILLILHYRTMS